MTPREVERWLKRQHLVVDARAQARAFPSRNPTLRCRDASGRAVFVKLALPGDEALAHERAVLSSLRDVASVPRLRAQSENVVALEWVRGQTLWALRRRSHHPAVDVAIGGALAALQLDGRVAVASTPVKGDLTQRLLWTTPEFFSTLGPAGCALVGQVQRHRAAMRTLQALLAAETDARATLVHGDLRQPNILVQRGEVSFVDFEHCGLGDPARDLGMLIAEDVRAWLHPTDAGEAQTRRQLESHARALVSGWEAKRSERAAPFDDEHRARVLGWVGEGLLRAAYTMAHHDGRLPQPLVDTALQLLAAPAETASTLLPLPSRGRGSGRGETPVRRRTGT